MDNNYTEVIEALPTKLVSLHQQIINAGGKGFGSAIVEAMENSFSDLYIFDTPDGKKALRTLNRFNVGSIDAEENHYVEYDANKQEYSLVTPSDIIKPPYKVLFILPLGQTFLEMLETVKSMWPERLVWKLDKPCEALAAKALSINHGCKQLGGES